MKTTPWILGAVVLFPLGAVLLNASRWAAVPSGDIAVIAHRGVHHRYDTTNLGRDDCTATRMLPGQETRDIFENTVRSIGAAVRLGADLVEVDVAPTADGHMVLFHDWTVDCRTDGTGKTRDLTLAELRSLDIGHGYTADGGSSFPLRGQGVGQVPTVEEALAAIGDAAFLFNFKSRDPDEADRLFAILSAAGRDPLASGDGFYGANAPVARIRALVPDAWAWSPASAKACTTDYAWQGWLGLIPKSCRGGTLLVPLNYRRAIAGWPNRTLERLRDVGGRVVVIGPYAGGDAARGLTAVEQLDAVPPDYDGYVMVEDITALGPRLARRAAPR